MPTSELTLAVTLAVLGLTAIINTNDPGNTVTPAQALAPPAVR